MAARPTPRYVDITRRALRLSNNPICFGKSRQEDGRPLRTVPIRNTVAANSDRWTPTFTPRFR